MRKIIQIIETREMPDDAGTIVALCNDGTTWKRAGDLWEEAFDAIPQPPSFLPATIVVGDVRMDPADTIWRSAKAINDAATGQGGVEEVVIQVEHGVEQAMQFADQLRYVLEDQLGSVVIRVEDISKAEG